MKVTLTSFSGGGNDCVFLKVRERCGVIPEGERKVFMERFSVPIKSVIHRALTRGRGLGVLSNGIGVGVKGCLH
jgi:hypothetical protein